MSEKHTPGPWRTGSLISYNGATGEPEAFVYRLHPDNPEETAHNRICVRGSKSMDCDADARLIVAAPDMLEALKRGRQKLLTYGACYPDDKELHKTLIPMWEAAISKAEPEEGR